jgi:iron complex transport system substrate-binding protein
VVAGIGSAAGASFTDAAGRHVALPARVEHVLAAGPPAALLLYTLAADKLIGWPEPLAPGTRKLLPGRYGDLPVVGRLTGKSGLSAAAIAGFHPDLIVDVADVDARYAKLADDVERRTGIPYILLDGRLSQAAATYLALGRVLGAEARAEVLADYAKQTLDGLRAHMASVSASKRPRAYYARQPDGLTTGAAGSLVGEFLDAAGALNVGRGGGGLTTTSLAQIAAWDPDVLVVLDPALYRRIRRDPAWAGLRARRGGRVYLAPNAPFGWIDEPPGINRLLGAQWLAAKLYPGGGDIREAARDFCAKFYRVDLTEVEIDRMLAAAP